MKPVVGAVAPAFSLPVIGGEFGPEGRELSLEELRGRWVVLYFYPKDDTPGCTTQACELRDHFASVSGRALVLGASPDEVKSHAKFIDKHQLPFAILADPSHRLMEDYGVWVEKSMYGKKYWGTERSTFVINPQGEIAAVLEKVQPAEHLAKVNQALDNAGAA